MSLYGCFSHPNREIDERHELCCVQCMRIDHCIMWCESAISLDIHPLQHSIPSNRKSPPNRLKFRKPSTKIQTSLPSISTTNLLYTTRTSTFIECTHTSSHKAERKKWEKLGYIPCSVRLRISSQKQTPSLMHIPFPYHAVPCCAMPRHDVFSL